MRSRPGAHGFWFRTFFGNTPLGWNHWKIRRITSTYILIVRIEVEDHRIEKGPEYVLLRWDDITKED